ncbi:MAG: type IV conjugative transfer system protein TraE [Gammaproteobacteria bacterium]
MKREIFINKLQEVIQKRNLFLLLTIVLMTIVLLQSVILINVINNTRIVLIPMPLKQTGWVDKNTISDSYLAEMTRYYSSLFLNMSEDDSNDRINEILHYSAPEMYGELKTQLLNETGNLKKKHISTWFSPMNVSVDTSNLTADITGDLHILVGKDETNVLRVTYRSHYVYRNGALLIDGFNEVKKSDK